MPSRGIIAFVLLGALVIGWLSWHSSRQLKELSVPAITKQPIIFANLTFDPSAPPADMPPLANGEGAECDSNFLSNASVSGESRQPDAAHATLTITQVRMTLQLNVTIWEPAGVSQHVIEHEDGHRQISEFYYQNADRLAGRIAAAYMGRQVEITGADLNAASNSMLQQLATEITNRYNKELNPEPTQLLYDAITDHSRNEVVVKDAIASALRDVKFSSTQPASNPGN